MTHVDHVYVVCNRGDLFRTQPCVASIRYFHPDVRITLVKDETKGPFSTTELENRFQVDTWTPPRRRCGFFSKLEVMLRPEKERFFLMDSDILFVGPVLSLFDNSPAEFVVSWEPGPDCERREMYSYSRLRQSLAPTFEFPGYYFCNGNIVATSGVLERQDFDPYVDFHQSIPTLRFPEIFGGLDQGVINFVMQSKAAHQQITLEAQRFMIWGFGDEAKGIPFEAVVNRTFRPALVHWAGFKSPTFRGDPRSDLWEFFDRYYHSGVRFGSVKRVSRSWGRYLRWNTLRLRGGAENCVRALLRTVGMLTIARRLRHFVVGTLRRAG